jgi:hypothetical protein
MNENLKRWRREGDYTFLVHISWKNKFVGPHVLHDSNTHLFVRKPYGSNECFFFPNTTLSLAKLKCNSIVTPTHGCNELQVMQGICNTNKSSTKPYIVYLNQVESEEKYVSQFLQQESFMVGGLLMLLQGDAT